MFKCLGHGLIFNIFNQTISIVTQIIRFHEIFKKIVLSIWQAKVYLLFRILLHGSDVKEFENNLQSRQCLT